MPLESDNQSRRYWRSLDELADTAEFRRWVESEFPNLPANYADGPTRRQVLKVIGASLALAGLTGCRWPKEVIVPATKQPNGRIPGVPVQYATAFELGGVATGVLVTSYDGRPIKIEGNEKHPFSGGKTNHWMQAGVLELYDPDRSRTIVQRPREVDEASRGSGLNRTWEEFSGFARRHFDELRSGGGRGLAILGEASSSPTLADMKGRLAAALPESRWYEYEPISRDNEREGSRLAFGRPLRSHLHLDQADVLVSLDSDLLMTHPAAVRYSGDFAARRRADDGTMNRLYVLESNLTVTGGMADCRFALRPSAIGAAIGHLAAAVSAKLGIEAGSVIPSPWVPRELEPAALKALAADLVGHRGRCALVAGPQQPAAVHAAVHALNAMLGVHGKTITFTHEVEPERPTHLAAIRTLAGRIEAGEVQTLVILGGNPAYDAPADLRFAELLASVPTTIHLGVYDDETGQRCVWHLPRAHWLESWGDALAYDGTLSLVQPLIDPLYDGRTPIELLALLTGDSMTRGHDLVRRTFGNLFDAGQNRQALWEQGLHDGVVADTAWPAVADIPSPGQRMPQLVDLSASPPAAGMEVALTPDYSVYDGRFANNAWLQEWPDPITKLTWDNAALISPADARKLGVNESGQHICIDGIAGEAGRKLTLPAFILPGQAEGCITVPLGYGRGREGGVVAEGAGVDAYSLRGSANPWGGEAGRVSRASGMTLLATTQDHHSISSRVGDVETRRRVPVLIRSATLEHYREHPDFVHHGGHEGAAEAKSLWQEKEYYGQKWGMAIDLSACTGCGACVLACQAENNVPVVGKSEVARGREMHWLRVDRYFSGGDEGMRGGGDEGDVRVVHQPVACAHCELAPCEQVCPVAATVHDEEGLNVMVYNRCIGTRYCSNNCPFKVRRFNWFYNHHGPSHPRSIRGGTAELPGKLKQRPLSDIEKLLNNPNVSVRSRGVMEKCTFCVQRIMAVKIQAHNERWTRIPDGLIVPACAQACPTGAIVFGDLNDDQSRVARLHAHQRAYGLLPELNLKARTKYLAKLTNAQGDHG